MNEERAKQAFKEGHSVTMPTGVVVSDIKAYHDEEKRFAEMKKAQKEAAATNPPGDGVTVADAVPPRLHGRGFGAGMAYLGPTGPAVQAASPIAPVTGPAPAPIETTTTDTTGNEPAAEPTSDDDHGSSNQPG
jgi:hypothetical protein